MSNQGLLDQFVRDRENAVDCPASTGSRRADFVGDNKRPYRADLIATGNVRSRQLQHGRRTCRQPAIPGCTGCSMGVGSTLQQPQPHLQLERERGGQRRVSSSIAGGFAARGSFIYDSQSSGNVTGGSNSLLGGFVGVHNIDGQIYASSTTGSTVTATGPNSWVGGFVGYNGGLIVDSTTSSTVTGTSSSVLGGFAAVNIGWIDPSVANGAVTATGANNILGGFAGLNLGTIDNSTSTGAGDRRRQQHRRRLRRCECGFCEFLARPHFGFELPGRHGEQLDRERQRDRRRRQHGRRADRQPPIPGTLPISGGSSRTAADTMCEIFRNGVFAAGQGDGPIIPNDGPIIPNDGPIVPNQVPGAAGVFCSSTCRIRQFQAHRRADPADQPDQPGPDGAAADQCEPADPARAADARYAARFAGAAAAAARSTRPRWRNPQQRPAAQRDALPQRRGRVPARRPALRPGTREPR